IKSQNVSNEVKALQNTFANLSRLFMVVSILVLTIGLFISIVLLVKLQNSRYKEIGLLSALGFSKNTIRAIITNENILLSILSAVINTFFVVITYLISGILNLDLIITIPQICLSTIATGIIVVLISFVASYKLINTQPAVALKK
ncbi:MAG: FtsX-like permease family protein, partial [Oscillospiraceae bacterium]